jgi:hypothetical protein
VFRRALEHGNLMVAEVTAREVGHIDLREALELTALIALSDRPRSRRVAARWLQRWLDESASPSIDEVAMVVGCLAALGGPRHDDSLAVLRALRTAARPRGHASNSE